MNWFHSYDGARIEVGNLQPDQVEDRTIAKALSKMCRFGCHSTAHISVAQHSILVAKAFAGTNLHLPALLHDAHEAYTGFGDMLRPAKAYLREHTHILDEIEGEVDVAIASHYGFTVDLFSHPDIKERDTRVLLAEHRDLMVGDTEALIFDLQPLPDKIQPVSPEQAFYDFLRVLEEAKKTANLASRGKN